MKGRSFAAICARAIVLLACAFRALLADTGVLVVHVSDQQDRPVRGLQIGLKSGGGTATTLDDGSARVPLAAGTHEHSFVFLQVVSSPHGRDLAIVSPFDLRVQVPSFENRPENYVSITVIERSDRAALTNGKIIFSIAAKINQANSKASTAPAADPRANLEAVARQYGYTPEEIDRAIRAWRPDPRDRIQSAQQIFYEGNYPAASDAFEQALQQALRERQDADRKIASAAYFLGSSRLKEGKYRQAAEADRQCSRIDPLNARCSNDLGVALKWSGELKEALQSLSNALTMGAIESGPNSLDVADYKNNLGTVFEEMGQYAQAERLYDDALKIRQAKLDASDPRIAQCLNNLGGPLEARGDNSQAKVNYESALAIYAKTGREQSLDAASAKNNLGGVLRKLGKYPEAETQYREALRIDQTLLPKNHPEIALVMENLAGILKLRGDRDTAERLYRDALEIKKIALAPTSTSLARGFSNLAVLLAGEKRYAVAVPMLRQALEINTKAYVQPDRIAFDQYNLALALEGTGDFVEAESLLRDALATDLKVLGPDHPQTLSISRSLQLLLQRESSK